MPREELRVKQRRGLARSYKALFQLFQLPPLRRASRHRQH
jgi:hypothetical protein